MDTTESEIYLDDIDMKVINLLKERSKMLFIEPQGNKYKIKIEWNEQAITPPVHSILILNR